MNDFGLVRYWRNRIALWTWERRYGRHLDTAESWEYWCGVCKTGHPIGEVCPDETGALTESESDDE